MKNLLYLIIPIFFLASCTDDEGKVHEIISFTPEKGLEGSEVTISGNGFIPDIGKNIVLLGTKQAEVISASATALVVKVPEDASSGKFSVSINNKVVYSVNNFTVQHVPVVDNLIYEEGPTGFEAYIYMHYAGDTPAKNIMKIGDAPVQITGVEVVNSGSPVPTQVIDFIIPNAASGPLTLTVDGIQATLVEHFRIYPIIDSFSPKGGAEGDIITIIGKNFSAVMSENIVRLDNPDPLLLVSATSTEIKALVPANARFGRLSVDYSSGPMFAKDYFVGPILYSFNPVTGPVGTMVNVYPFFPMPGITPPVVKFNGTAATEIYLSDGIKARIPANATTGKITITHNGFTATSTSDFTVQ